MRTLEDGSGANGEILLALVATIITTFAYAYAFSQSTYRTMRTFRPKSSFQINPRGLLIWKHLEEFKGADGYVVFHGSLLNEWSNYPSIKRGSQVYNSQKIHFDNATRSLSSTYDQLIEVIDNSTLTDDDKEKVFMYFVNRFDFDTENGIFPTMLRMRNGNFDFALRS